jgi:hypothetical protein
VLFGALLLLWCAIHSPFMWGFKHVESKCDQVSMSLSGYSVQSGFERRVGQKNIFVVVVHVLGILEFLCLCDLGFCDYGIFPKLVGEFMVDLFIGSSVFCCDIFG